MTLPTALEEHSLFSSSAPEVHLITTFTYEGETVHGKRAHFSLVETNHLYTKWILKQVVKFLIGKY
jgi:hypothetical protein